MKRLRLRRPGTLPDAKGPTAAPRATALQPRLSRLVSKHSGSYVRAIAAARKRPSRAAVHALRVATRRLLALRELVRFADPNGRDRKLDQYLGAPFRPCGRLRDLQVIHRQVLTLLQRFPEAEEFLSALKRRERKARERATRALDAAHPRRIARLLAEIATHLDEATADRAGRDRAARRVALQIASAAREADAARARAQSGDPQLIHRARLALKSVRYKVEQAESLGLRSVASEVARLGRAQTEMGEITDRTTLLNALDGYSGKHPRAGARIARLRASVQRERQTLIARFLAAGERWHPAGP